MAWTQRTAIAGAPADLVWAADMSRYAANPRFLSAVRPTVGAGVASDLRVGALVAGGPGVAWVSGGGRVVAAFSGELQSSSGIGTGTQGAGDPQPGGSDGSGLGLLANPLVQKNAQAPAR